MSGVRRGLGMGVIAALVVAVWAAFAAGDDEPDDTTTTTSITTVPMTSPSTASTVATTTPGAPSPSTTSPSPSTTVDAEARAEEVRLILEDLWFRWFDAIYREDEEAVRDVVATSRGLDDFQGARNSLELPREPRPEDIEVSVVEVLLDRSNCLVAYSSLDLSSWLGEGSTRTGVDVLYPHEDGWRFATHWVNDTDLWENDCDAVRSDELP